MPPTQERPRLFYGWVIVGFVVLNAAILSGTAFLSIGVFVNPLEERFGWSRAAIAAAYSNSLLLAGFIGPFAGRFVDKYGTRVGFAIGLGGMAGSFALLAGVTSLWQLHLFFLLSALFRPFSSYIPSSVLLARWFVRRRATTLGLVAAGYSVGGILVPITALIVGRFGFRAGFLFDTALIAALIPPVFLLLRERPADLGLQADGGARRESPMPQSAHGVVIEHEATLAEAIRSRAFWYLTLALTLLFTSQGSFLLHGVPFFESVGRSTATATLIMLGLTLTTGGIRSVLGILVDRVAYPHRLAASLATSMAISLVILTFSTQTLAIALFMPLWAVGMAGGPVFEPLLYLRSFGTRHFGQILGVAGVIETFGLWGGPIFAGYVYDVTGSYRLALAVFAGIFLVAGLLFLRAGHAARHRAGEVLSRSGATIRPHPPPEREGLRT